MNKLVRSVMYIVLLITIPGALFFLLPTHLEYQVIERYTFSSDQDGNQFSVAVLLPLSGAYQEINNVQIAWPGEVLRRQYDEVELVILDQPPGGSALLEAEISYEASLAQGNMRWNANVEESHLLPQKNIESDAPELLKAAETICSGQKVDQAYPVYSFTAGYLSWPTGTQTGGEQSALAAYNSRIGVCGEFANLMTALNRACGIPAKSISGLSMPMFSPPMMTTARVWNHPGGAHAWVEVYTDGKWAIADPSWASQMPFNRLWFGRSLGQYLSYGEVGEQERIYDEIIAWGEERGTIIGAMSAPNKFVAVSSDENAAVTPSVQVKKVKDHRWILAVSSFLLLTIAANRIESRAEKLKQKGKRMSTPDTAQP